jgi:hypothetical protein
VSSILFGLVLLLVYFVPTIVAWGRHRMTASVFVVNLFLGWTLIAWVVALAMAVSGTRRDDAERAYR